MVKIIEMQTRATGGVEQTQIHIYYTEKKSHKHNKEAKSSNEFQHLAMMAHIRYVKNLT